MKASWRVIVIGLLVAAAYACGNRGAREAGRPRVRIAAASDLSTALGELVPRFTGSRAVDVTVSYGSSGNLYAQLLNGAPFDLFLSADVAYPKALEDRGLTLPDSKFIYATGRIVIWVPAASILDVGRDGLSALTSAEVTRIAIANPEHAPYGRAAVAAMQRAGVYERIRPKLVFGENVAQALQFVQSGAADAGVVALSLALAPNSKSRGRWAEIPLDQYPRIEQAGVILKAAADADAARAFRAFLTSADGRGILKQFGFSVAGD